MHHIATHFPITQTHTYLNTAASGLLPLPVLEWRRAHDQEFFETGGLLKAKQGDFLAETRETVGSFFNCAPNRVALLPNFSYGMNTLLESIPNKCTNVLMIEGDYPSLRWPFTSRDFNVHYVPVTSSLEDDIVHAFAKAQPDIFAFSIVQWTSGIKLDLSVIKELKAKYPDTIFIADGTQYVGTASFDFDHSGIDVLGASTYKWLNAGYGNGFYLFKPEMAETLAPKTTGFNSLQGKYKPQEGNFIGHFEPGHQDTLNFGSLTRAIQYAEEVGVSEIAKQIQALSRAAKSAFVARNILSEVVANRKSHSSIFNLKGDQKLYEILTDNKVLCAQRGDGIRVSFHYYNTVQDLEKLLNFL